MMDWPGLLEFTVKLNRQAIMQLSWDANDTCIGLSVRAEFRFLYVSFHPTLHCDGIFRLLFALKTTNYDFHRKFIPCQNYDYTCFCTIRFFRGNRSWSCRRMKGLRWFLFFCDFKRSFFSNMRYVQLFLILS